MNRIRSNWLANMIIFFIIFLICFGVFMIYSASHIWTLHKYNDGLFYVKRQFIFALVGLGALWIIKGIPYGLWRRYAVHLYVACLLLLVLVLVPGIGIVRGGAQSWIGFGLFSIQPSEFAKLGTIIFISYFLARTRKKQNVFLFHFILPLFFVCIPFAIIMLQPDLGTGIVLCLTIIVLLFVNGAKIKYFMSLCLIGLGGFTLLIMSAPYRIRRITSFLDPWKDPQGDGFQIIQSLLAIGPGKFFGVGYGQSVQKHFYLPEPQTDFIFAIIAEEFGLIGSVAVIVLFFLLCYYCWQIAYDTKDDFARNVIIGITSMIIIQTFINISVVIGLIPVTGITLPFISYGGSSLVLTLISFGIVLSCRETKI